MRVAVPNGRFSALLSSCLTALGIVLTDSRRYTLEQDGLLVKFLKPQDIPLLLSRGDIDVGFVPEEWVLEHPVELDLLLEMPGYRVTIAAIVSERTSARTLAEFWQEVPKPVRVVTQYERITTNHLESRGLTNWKVQKVSGAAEAYIPELADVVIDCVETGATLMANQLKILETLCNCRVLLVASRDLPNDQKESAQQFAKRLLGFQQDFRMLSK